MFRYLAIFEPCPDLPGSYTMTFPDVPGAITQGDGIADAREMAVDALEVMLGTYIAKGEDLPAVANILTGSTCRR